MAQPREAFAHSLEDIDGTVAVLNVGGVDKDGDEKAAGVCQDVALAAFDLLSRVIAARALAMRASHMDGDEPEADDAAFERAAEMARCSMMTRAV
jgi:hypothetical protein